MARPKKITQPKRYYQINIGRIDTDDDILDVLEYLTKDILIPLDGDLAGIAHLVDEIEMDD